MSACLWLEKEGEECGIQGPIPWLRGIWFVGRREGTDLLPIQGNWIWAWRGWRILEGKCGSGGVINYLPLDLTDSLPSIQSQNQVSLNLKPCWELIKKGMIWMGEKTILPDIVKGNMFIFERLSPWMDLLLVPWREKLCFWHFRPSLSHSPYGERRDLMTVSVVCHLITNPF